MRRKIRICGLLFFVLLLVACDNKNSKDLNEKTTKEIEVITTSNNNEKETVTKPTIVQQNETEIVKDFIVVCNKLNVRSEPNKDSEIIRDLYKNTLVKASKVSEGSWYRLVNESDEELYVSGDYLMDISDNQISEYNQYQIKEESAKYAMITADSVNIRMLPNSTTGTTVGSFTNGQTFEIIAITENDWYMIEYDHEICYISSQFSKLLTKEEYEYYSTKISKGEFEKLNTTLIGTYSTDYTPLQTNRSINVEKASDQIDSFVIPPEYTFNWCRDMGPCGKDEGYLSSTEISGGQYVIGYGGGICQISCTLCAAIMQSKGEFEFVERHQHSRPQPYIPRDMDATVSYPKTNFIIKNCNDFPVMIKSFYKDGIVTVEIYKIK